MKLHADPAKPTAAVVRRHRKAIQLDARRFQNSPVNRRLLGDAIRRQQPARDSTFLFVPAAAGDHGVRPAPPGLAYWNSAGLELKNSAGAIVTAGDLVAGQTYELSVTTANGGDLDAYAAHVEWFLAPVSIGSVPGGAQLGGVQSLQVPGHGNQRAIFPFTATPSMVGSRTLVARIFSVVNNDCPATADAFDAAADRHVAVQSFLIVDAGALSISFDVRIGDENDNQPLSIVFRRNSGALDALRRYAALQSATAAPDTLFKAWPVTITSPGGAAQSVNATAQTGKWKAAVTLGAGVHHVTAKFAGIQVPPQHAAVFDVEVSGGGRSLGGLEFVLVR